ncbi:MAG TPA: alpha/beta hydrolase [Anaeromyxobacteraceae bacterium]|nr:alpha/beta hydrolase [Anaeromyxobacteraceae bacterium]
MEPVPRSVVANGLSHHVLEWDGGGPSTVLCLHGFLDRSWAYHRVAPALAAAGHHVVAPDLRGHGETERVGPGGYYYFLDYLLDLADLVDALARDELNLVGHSMGAAVAGYYAGTFPSRVARAALLERPRLPDTPLASVPERTAAWIAGARRARLATPRVHPTLAEAARRIRERDPRCPEEEALFLARHGTRPVAGGFAFLHDPLHLTRGPYPFRAEVAAAYWSAIRCPLLLLDGEEGSPVPDDPLARTEAFRTARRVVVEGAGHMLLRHRPAEVARLLLRFLAE